MQVAQELQLEVKRSSMSLTCLLLNSWLIKTFYLIVVWKRINLYQWNLLEFEAQQQKEELEAQAQQRKEELEAQQQKEQLEAQKEERAIKHEREMRALELNDHRIAHEESIATKFDLGKNLRLVPPFNESEVDKYFQHFERVTQNLRRPTD